MMEVRSDGAVLTRLVRPRWKGVHRASSEGSPTMGRASPSPSGMWIDELGRARGKGRPTEETGELPSVWASVFRWWELERWEGIATDLGELCGRNKGEREREQSGVEVRGGRSSALLSSSFVLQLRTDWRSRRERHQKTSDCEPRLPVNSVVTRVRFWSLIIADLLKITAQFYPCYELKLLLFTSFKGSFSC